MADRVELLLNSVSPTAITSGTYGSVISTDGRRDFMVFLSMPSTTGSAVNDLMDFWIEQSSEQAFTNSYKIMLVPLIAPLTGTISSLFTQVTGNLTLPSATVNTGGTSTTANTTLLRQMYQININPNSYLRAGYRVQGTATSFTNVNLYLLSNTVP